MIKIVIESYDEFEEDSACGCYGCYKRYVEAKLANLGLPIGMYSIKDFPPFPNDETYDCAEAEVKEITEDLKGRGFHVMASDDSFWAWKKPPSEWMLEKLGDNPNEDELARAKALSYHGV